MKIVVWFAIAAFVSLLTFAEPVSSQTWTQTSAPITNWSSVASSADGSQLVATANGGFGDAGPIFISTNSGATWTQTSAPLTNWSAVASSADGGKLVAAAGAVRSFYDAPIFTSTDSGATWVQTSAPFSAWTAVASSADGAKLVAGTWFRDIYLSTDGGGSWTRAAGFPPGNNPVQWTAVASSADGTKLAAGGCFCDVLLGDPIYTSADSGITWTNRSFCGDRPYIASSADGNTLIVASGNWHPVATSISTNQGATWTMTNIYYTPVACSADGATLVELGYGQMRLSTDSGRTWAQAPAPSQNWAAMASSADANKLVAVANPGGIWTFQATPAPALGIAAAGSNLVLSWIVPSADLFLHENPDLTPTNWTDVTNAPTLNLTNLHNDVTVPASTGNRFYRLKQ